MRVLGRAPAEEAEGVARKLGLGEERGQTGDQQHAHRPRRVLHQQRGVADDGDAVLRQPESAHHQRERPARGLAPRAHQLVVELAVLELRELERQRLLEDHHVDALAELRAQQRLREREPALGGGDAGDDQRLERDVAQHRANCAAPVCRGPGSRRRRCRRCARRRKRPRRAGRPRRASGRRARPSAAGSCSRPARARGGCSGRPRRKPRAKAGLWFSE